MSALPDPAALRDTYDRQAGAFDAGRGRELFEEGWLQRFVRPLKPGARILDLGCGTGDPIARWLLEQGFAVTGLDFSAEMLAIARNRLPEGRWCQGDMRQLALSERFDGIIGWNSFFHLTRDEQRACLPQLAGYLNPGGMLMLTIGPMDGETGGWVGEEGVYHASLCAHEYTRLLHDAGLRLRAYVAQDETCNDHSVLLARSPSEGETP